MLPLQAAKSAPKPKRLRRLYDDIPPPVVEAMASDADANPASSAASDADAKPADGEVLALYFNTFCIVFFISGFLYFPLLSCNLVLGIHIVIVIDSCNQSSVAVLQVNQPPAAKKKSERTAEEQAEVEHQQQEKRRATSRAWHAKWTSKGVSCLRTELFNRRLLS